MSGKLPGDDLVAAEMPEPIPVIDLNRLSDASEASKLWLALQSWGIFMLTNHGVETSLMDAVMMESRMFFHQPLEEKGRCKSYLEKNQESKSDWVDRLLLTLGPKDEMNRDHWPKHPESFRDVVDEYTTRTKKIRDDILQAMAKLVELDEDYFINQITDKAATIALINYYPPSTPDSVIGFKPHSDGRLITILLVDKDVDGLQVLRDGTWYNVPIIPNAMLIFIGDSMEIMSNGIFRSAVHRVVTNTKKDRLSVAVFYGVDGEKVLEPLAGFVDEKRPAIYRKMKAKDFTDGLRKYFSQGMRFIDTMKMENISYTSSS